MESITVHPEPLPSPPRVHNPLVRPKRKVYVDPYTMSKYIEEISLSIGPSIPARVLRV